MESGNVHGRMLTSRNISLGEVTRIDPKGRRRLRRAANSTRTSKSSVSVFLPFFRFRYPHQISGVQWLWKMHNSPYKGALLADDMGLGKTVQVCTYLQCIADRGLLDSCLIVVPNSVVPVWQNAFREWTSRVVFCSYWAELSVILFHSLSPKGKKDIQDKVHNAFSVVLTTYGTLDRNVEYFSSFWTDTDQASWDYVVLDEGHKVLFRLLRSSLPDKKQQIRKLAVPERHPIQASNHADRHAAPKQPARDVEHHGLALQPPAARRALGIRPCLPKAHRAWERQTSDAGYPRLRRHDGEAAARRDLQGDTTTREERGFSRLIDPCD